VLLDSALYQGAQRLAQRGAQLARQAGFDASGLAVADELTIAETLVRIARDRDAAGILVGARGRGVTKLLVGSTSKGLIERADRPVVVVRVDKEA
jgi:nucleotide-binding universal stress UspA family protein